MKRAAAAAGALTGFVLLWHLMPRHDAALGDTQVTIGRKEAIEIAVRWARQHGVETGGWRFAVGSEVDPLLMRVRRASPNSRVAGTFTPIRIRVLAYNSRGDAVLATMTANGRPLSFLDRRANPAGEPLDNAAEQELLRLAGANAGEFVRTADNVRTLEGSRSAWEWLDPGLNGALARVVVVTRNGRVVNSSYEFSATREAAGEPPPGRPWVRVALMGASAAAAVALGGLALWSLFAGLLRRTDQLGFAARFLWIPAAALASPFLTGSYQNQALLESFNEGLVGDTRLMMGITVSLLVLLGIFLVTAAAYAAVPARHFRLWAPAALLAHGQWRNREAAEQIWTGIAWGALIGAAPYLIAPLAGVPRVRFLEGTALLTAPWPPLEALEGLASAWEVYLVVLFFAPWLAARVKRAWQWWAMLLAAGALVASLPRVPFPPGHWGNLACGAAMTAGYAAVYLQGGMLGTWFAPLGMYGAVQGIRMAHLAAPSLEAAGWQMLALVFGFALVALAASFALPRADVEGMAARMAEAAAALPRPQRERLRAEFGVARRAQRDLLPLAPPEIPGFEVAAICQPALEVGGDLYDYLPCPQGEWMLCVADVSGKGLGAALYMTLLKGMLASAAHHAPALEILAARMNQAVAGAGRGRMFVTLSLLALDPDTRRVRHLRAGHNPPVRWRAATGECEFLRPRGIGLGLTAGPAFEANLDVQTLVLEPGDVIVMYSDGVTEDMDAEGRLFGEARLVEAIRRHASAGAARLADAIMEEARAFRGVAELHDDWTLLVLRCLPAAAAPGGEASERRNEA
ncbi:MAG: PP2C family protein-serine/threonine phosphatase [Bryobacteraceae bacterium]|nr:PP2C family protein-serine/threonine phosphatase [Bryobacteraceae bacterium]